MNTISSFTRDELLQIARSQRTIISLILVNLLLLDCLVVSIIMLGPESRSAASIVLVVRWTLLLLNLIAVVFICRLATALRQTAWVYAVAAFLPCVSLHHAASHQPLRYAGSAATRCARGFNGSSEKRLGDSRPDGGPASLELSTAP